MPITWLEQLPAPASDAAWQALETRLAALLPPLTAAMPSRLADDVEHARLTLLVHQLTARYAAGRPRPPAVAAFLRAFYEHV